jgi:polyhydroxyalkanoate synthase
MQATTAFGRSLTSYYEKQTALWTSTLSAGAGNKLPPVVEADRGDRRFHGERWSSHPWFNLLKQTYLLNSQLLDSVIDAAEMDPRQKHKLRFFARQFIDAMSPANFASTNPKSSMRCSSPRAKPCRWAWST